VPELLHQSNFRSGPLKGRGTHFGGHALEGAKWAGEP